MMNTPEDGRKPEYGNGLLYNIYSKFTSYMNDDDVDLEINPESRTIAVQNRLAEWRCAGTVADGRDIETLGCILAGLEEKTLNAENPVLDTKMPFDDARIHVRIPTGGFGAALSIRRHSAALGDMRALLETGMFTSSQMETMLRAVRERRSVIISGETGSGKTTLLTALANEIPSGERILIIEDTREIFINESHWNRSEITTGMFLSGFDAVKASLRENPSRIIYGEVRDEAALALIESWLTGHRGGMGTVHAQNARGILRRFLRLCSAEESGGAKKKKRTGGMSAGITEEDVRDALDLGVQILFDDNGRRRVSEIFDFKKNERIG